MNGIWKHYQDRRVVGGGIADVGLAVTDEEIAKMNARCRLSRSLRRSVRGRCGLQFQSGLQAQPHSLLGQGTGNYGRKPALLRFGTVKTNPSFALDCIGTV